MAITAFFTLEAILKLIAYSKNYFLDYWNDFDFLIITLTLATVVIQYSFGGLKISSAQAIKTFRCARIIRLITKLERLKVIYKTIVITIPALFNIGIFLILIIYFYAVLGNNLFCFVKYGEGITSEVNFQTFGRSFLTLLKIATLEEWFFIFNDCNKLSEPNDACLEVESYQDFLKYGKK